MRTATSTTSNLVYFLGDHLGSTSITVNPDGSKAAEMRYTAWGETRYTSGATPTDYQYTGQRNDTGIGLYFYNARWYDPVLGRFAQADSVVPGGVQGLDRYSYIKNNPVNGTDPTGHCPEDDEACRARLYATLPPPQNPQFFWSSSNASSVGVGEASSVLPATTESYGENAEETTSYPEDPTGLSGAVLLAGDALAWGQNNIAANAPNDIFVNANYTTLPDSSISVTSLNIYNAGSNIVSVKDVFLSARFNDLPCSSACYTRADFSYGLVSGSSISRPGQTAGFGVARPHGNTVISLIPSGNLLNPKNIFQSSAKVFINVVLADTNSGQLIANLIRQIK